MNVFHLVYTYTDGAVQDSTDQQALHVSRLDVQLARDELDLDMTVRLDQLDEDLGPDVPQQVLNVLPDESVFHDGLPAHL